MKQTMEKIEYLSTVLIDFIIYKYMYNSSNMDSIKYLYEDIDIGDIDNVDVKYKNAFNRIEDVIRRILGETNELQSYEINLEINDFSKVFAIQKLMVINSNMYLSKLMKRENINDIEEEDTIIIENIVNELDYLVMMCINYLIQYIVSGEKKIDMIKELYEKISYFINRNKVNEYTMIRYNRVTYLLDVLGIKENTKTLKLNIDNALEDFDNHEKAIRLATASLINNTL